MYMGLFMHSCMDVWMYVCRYTIIIIGMWSFNSASRESLNGVVKAAGCLRDFNIIVLHIYYIKHSFVLLSVSYLLHIYSTRPVTDTNQLYLNKNRSIY